MGKRFFNVFIVLIFLGVLSGIGSAGSTVREVVDISYVPGSVKVDKKQTLDVFYPSGGKDCAVLLFIHGGGWSQGDKARYARIGRIFAEKGCVVVNINYRLSPSVQHPSHVRDAAAAVAWTKKHVSEYGGDPGKIFVFGHSAGGHITALLASDPVYLGEFKLRVSDLAGIIPISGVYDLNYPDHSNRPRLKSFMKSFPYEEMRVKAFGEDRSVWKKASPVTHVNKKMPPALILYGEKENPVIRKQAGFLKKAMDDSGARVSMKSIPGANHFTIISGMGSGNDPVSEAILDFVGSCTSGGKSGGGEKTKK